MCYSKASPALASCSQRAQTKTRFLLPNFNVEFHTRETSASSSSTMNFCRIRNSFKEQQVRKENLDDLNFFVFQVSTSTKLEHEEELDLTDEPKDQKQILVLELKTMPEGKNKKAVKFLLILIKNLGEELPT